MGGVSYTRVVRERNRFLNEREVAVANLYDSLVREVRSIRLARATGYRAVAWDRIKQASELDTPACDLEALRHEAVACLGDFVGNEPTGWHGHPVWFLDSWTKNPIVGTSKLKDCIRLLFWSGQSFDEPGLEAEGSFKAAEARYTSDDQIAPRDLKRWLDKSIEIQWDYKNIVKRKGKLERLK